MFLASASGLRKATEIPFGLLVKEVIPKQDEGPSESTEVALLRLANPDSVGMSTDAGYFACPYTTISGVLEMRSLELFSGAGGLALGASRAGFEHLGVVELNHDACSSMKENKRRGMKYIQQWPIRETDVRSLRYSDYGTDIELLAGGVPCQPWSQGGNHKGQDDQRNLFPEMIRAVRETQPKAVLVENVKGLLRQSFSSYFEYIMLGLSYPELIVKPGESWERHLKRLEKHHTSRRTRGLEYKVTFRLINAADYGVPQRRERVFIVAFRSDLPVEWSFPEPTHSKESLAISKWVTGEYWDRHNISKRKRSIPTSRDLNLISKSDLFTANQQPWLTVRDALIGLPEPSLNGSESWVNHILVPGARSYPGHTGSPLDESSKTLKAGDHGVPGGENTLVMENGEVRYFTVREAARIQSFPDEYFFPVAWTESMRQLGNAVPVRLAERVARSIRDHLLQHYAKTGWKAGARFLKAV
jgi:DNA (cytosine-5)-methyltransferase 1